MEFRMRRFTKWSLIACAGVSLLALPPQLVRADDPAVNPPAAAAPAPLAFPAGFQLTSTNPDEGIRTGLNKLTERALTKGDFNSMLEELSKPDRERARAFKGVDQGKLDVQIDRIQKSWMAKYGKEFKPDAKAVFGAPLLIIEGEVTDPAVALTTWPVACCSEQAVPAGARQAPGTAKELKKTVRAEKLEKGRNVALVQFPAAHGMPALTVSMIHHLPAFWRIDVPNDVAGEQIYNDLLTQLTWIGDNSDKWPNDINEAYRLVAYHVASALYGTSGQAVKG
jgi:hypothetical protein